MGFANKYLLIGISEYFSLHSHVIENFNNHTFAVKKVIKMRFRFLKCYIWVLVLLKKAVKIPLSAS